MASTSPPRTTLTPRGQWVLGAGALVLASALVVVVLVVVQRPQLIGAVPGLSDCTATVGDDDVALTTAQAETAAAVSARSMRLDLPHDTTTQALTGELGLPAEEATVVAGALRGTEQAALTCRHGGVDEPGSPDLDAQGLTDRAATLRAELLAAYGDLPLGGFAPGGVSDGHMPGSAHYDGRAVDVFFRPVGDEEQLRRGWAVAHYLVAHAERLGVETVIFDAQIWTARRSVQGWRDYEPDTAGRPADVAEILEHREHVHVDVGR